MTRKQEYKTKPSDFSNKMKEMTPYYASPTQGPLMQDYSFYKGERIPYGIDSHKKGMTHHYMKSTNWTPEMLPSLNAADYTNVDYNNALDYLNDDLAYLLDNPVENEGKTAEMEYQNHIDDNVKDQRKLLANRNARLVKGKVDSAKQKLFAGVGTEKKGFGYVPDTNKTSVDFYKRPYDMTHSSPSIARAIDNGNTPYPYYLQLGEDLDFNPTFKPKVAHNIVAQDSIYSIEPENSILKGYDNVMFDKDKHLTNQLYGRVDRAFEEKQPYKSLYREIYERIPLGQSPSAENPSVLKGGHITANNKVSEHYGSAFGRSWPDTERLIDNLAKATRGKMYSVAAPITIPASLALSGRDPMQNVSALAGNIGVLGSNLVNDVMGTMAVAQPAIDAYNAIKNDAPSDGKVAYTAERMQQMADEGELPQEYVDAYVAKHALNIGEGYDY